MSQKGLAGSKFQCGAEQRLWLPPQGQWQRRQLRARKRRREKQKLNHMVEEVEADKVSQW